MADSAHGQTAGGGSTVVWRGDPDYEATRRRMVWNARVPDPSRPGS